MRIQGLTVNPGGSILDTTNVNLGIVLATMVGCSHLTRTSRFTYPALPDLKALLAGTI